jgi:hypothetical protein
MEYLVPSLRIIAFKDMDDTSTIRESLVQLVKLEEDRFIAIFHQQVQKERERPTMTDTSRRRSLSKVIWYWYMTLSS